MQISSRDTVFSSAEAGNSRNAVLVPRPCRSLKHRLVAIVPQANNVAMKKTRRKPLPRRSPSYAPLSETTSATQRGSAEINEHRAVDAQEVVAQQQAETPP